MKVAQIILALLIPAFAAAPADNQLTQEEKEQGWILLFDGRSMDRWMTSDWQPIKRPVEEGSINPHKAGTSMVVYEQEWTDFVLALDFKITKGCNSGIFVRTSPLKEMAGKDVAFNGIEVQILDSPNAGFKDTGAIYDLVKPTKNAMKPVGEWNHIEISVNKNIIDVVLNGEHVNNIDLDRWTQPHERPDGSKHKFGRAYKYHPRTGYIGFQDHGADLWFKNIKLKPLD